ncbi:MAG: HAMP domain-containing protein, partial [Gammaproteobacteria bacterium]|nr:HAMP domain-containing protein [Gammaproteobacteria bacterium]
MRAFSDRPLTNKLMIIILSTSATALIFTMLINVVREGLNYREAYTDQLSTLTEVVGTNSVAALTFEDKSLAGQVLRSLEAEPGVIAAHLLDRQGDFVAFYLNEDHANTPSGSIPVDRELIDAVIAERTAMHAFSGLDYIDMVRPVEFDNDIIGYVQVRANLERLESRLKDVTVTAIAAILIAVLIAYFVSVKLQAVISAPILSLVDVMKRVTAEKDYELRAEKRSNDEIGVLIDGFNEMLKEI